MKFVSNILIAVLGFTGILVLNSMAADGGHEHGAHASPMLEGYLAVANALYKDDLATAQKAATELAELDKKSALAKPALAVAAATTIEESRTAFVLLSQEAIKVAAMDKDSKLTPMKCPMVKGGNGVWLSADGKVDNPYFGARMPHCGGPMKK